MPPSLAEWLPEDHLAWFVLAAVDEMDLSAFYASYRADGHGRAAEPAMMLSLLLYGYAKGQRSSRAIERACVEDVAPSGDRDKTSVPIRRRSRAFASATKPHEILAEEDAVDQAEDERYGDARGDELPPQLSTRHGRQAWLPDAKRRLDERRAQHAWPVPRSRREGPKEAKRRLDEELATECAAKAAYED